MLESGVRTPNPKYANLNDTPQLGITTDQTIGNRVRALGGTSSLWGGFGRPLEEADFQKRSWVPDSGWPIEKKDLDPYYQRAHEILGLPHSNYELEQLDPAFGTSVPLNDENFENVAFFFSQSPMRFGEYYEARLSDSPRIQVYLDSTVVEIETQENGRAATGVRVATLSGKKYHVLAKRIVIATGALQAARLLLNSDSVHRSGLGNQFDLVGRNFLQHPVWYAPFLSAVDDQVFHSLRRSNNRDSSIVTAIRADAAERLELLNFHFLAIRTAPKSLYQQSRQAAKGMRDRAANIWNQSVDVWSVGEFLNQFEEAVAPNSGHRPFRFHCAMRPEQAPNRDSRITLSNETDAVGMRRAVMDWRLSRLDHESMWQGTRALAQSMGKQRMGRVNMGKDRFEIPDPSSTYLHGGHHHYGTARMSDSPRDGVVDRFCRIHGVPNVYIASSAVFPTTGYANPTLSIVAVAARIAATLASERAQ